MKNYILLLFTVLLGCNHCNLSPLETDIEYSENDVEVADSNICSDIVQIIIISEDSWWKLDNCGNWWICSNTDCLTRPGLRPSTEPQEVLHILE